MFNTMQLPTLWAPLLLTLGCLTSTLLYLRRTRRLPGPPGWPLVGNFLEMPRRKIYLKFEEWRKTYGDAYFVNLLGQKILVLSSREASAEVLGQKSAFTSGRPRFVMVRAIEPLLGFT